MTTVLWLAGGIGLAAGVVASGAMELYQAYAAPSFKLPDSDEEPSTVMSANALSVLMTGRKVPETRRDAAGRAVHYGTGAVLGLIYGIIASLWPPATTGFGLAWGAMVWVGLDLVGVPSFGWGKKPWQNPPNALAYALSAHLVFGVVTEGVRRGLAALFA